MVLDIKSGISRHELFAHDRGEKQDCLHSNFMQPV